ncbi:hypothetical protein EV363DRAFT_1552110 [Boletus edulis]|nr:hypothetical protein EV363DRAFT_1552110 [Boletus edulis]
MAIPKERTLPLSQSSTRLRQGIVADEATSPQNKSSKDRAPLRQCCNIPNAIQYIRPRLLSTVHHALMVPVTNKCIILKALGLHVLGQTTTTFNASQTIDLDNIPLNGGILAKTLIFQDATLSCQFVRRRSGSHFGAQNMYQIGDTIEGLGIGVVLRSEIPTSQVGDHLHGPFPFQECHNEYDHPWSVFVGIAGVPDMTAGRNPRARKIITGGSFVIQLAKRDGMKVTASAGSDDKVELLKEQTRCSYRDNVGGETLEAALNAAAKHARFIECEMISAYDGSSKPISNIIHKEITINGFFATMLFPKYLETFEQDVPALVASKELTYSRGFENAEVALDNSIKRTNRASKSSDESTSAYSVLPVVIQTCGEASWSSLTVRLDSDRQNGQHQTVQTGKKLPVFGIDADSGQAGPGLRYAAATPSLQCTPQTQRNSFIGSRWGIVLLSLKLSLRA